MSERPALGFIGIGLMGRPMVLRLLDAGYRVTVWNRSRDRLAPVLARGAIAADSPAGAARAAGIVMLCVTDQHAVREVLFGPDGVAAGGTPGTIVVDFSSIAPAAAREHAGRLERECAMGLVDAPVSGGVPGAEQGTLAVMAGGRPEHVERVRPVIAHLSRRFTRMGEAGAGQVAKLCNQVLVGALLPVLAEAIRLAEAGGIDATRLPEALRGGFADSIPLQLFGPRMAARSWQPALGAADTMRKDLDNALALARETGVSLPMLQAAMQRYQALAASGRGAEEPSALIGLLDEPRR
ncbi:MAG: NAD(P)-dependent oxidoreductase [Burkholderiaceae bacterium]|nr:NAD(P)-dependent oxidoreductase [Burkholderiaceae bacterium]